MAIMTKQVVTSLTTAAIVMTLSLYVGGCSHPHSAASPRCAAPAERAAHDDEYVLPTFKWETSESASFGVGAPDALDDVSLRNEFSKHMLGDSASKLGQLAAKVKAESVDADGKPSKELRLGDWQLTYNERDGVDRLFRSYSAFVSAVETQGTGHVLTTQYLLTVDEDYDQRNVKMSVRSLTPLTLRAE